MNKNKFAQLWAILFSLIPLVLSAQSPPASCEQITIQTIDNNLIISGLDLASIKLRVADANFNLIQTCEFDCDPILNIEGGTSGDVYRLTFEFFSVNFSYLSQENISYVLGSEAIEIGICVGDVVLADQSEVNAFCGCEIITGTLDIGERFGPSNDINDISNLGNIKVTEDLRVVRTNLTTLSTLENLHIGRGIGIRQNQLLQSIDAFNQLEVIQDLGISGNPSLEQINGFQQLKEAILVLSIASNAQLTTLNGFGNLETINSFFFVGNNAFRVLDELSSLSRIGDRFSIERNNQLESIVIAELSGTVEDFRIFNNPVLTNLPAIGRLTITQDLQIYENPNLSDCCALVNLFDDDLTNGQNRGTLNLRDNGTLCNSTLDILENCGGTIPMNCDDIMVNSSNNNLIINGINSPIAIIKVYDEAFQLVYECSNDCNSAITISDLKTCESYTIDVQLFDENYSLICDRKFSQVVTGTPADNLVCKRTIILRSQADVDAFCGCQKIEGSLYIGFQEANDITDISNLAVVEEVTDFLSITETQLTNLTSLEIKKVGRSMSIQNNPILEDIHGFNELNVPEFINIFSNPALRDISGFQQSPSLETVTIRSNDALEKVTGFGSLVSIYNLSITRNNQLKDIATFSDLEVVEAQIGIRQNSSLTRVDFPKLSTTAVLSLEENASLETVELADNFSVTFLRIIGNTNLTDCCFLKPLVDDDFTNGIVGDGFVIRDNGNMCNTVEEILASCTSSPVGCENIELISNDNQLEISGISAPNAIVKVFDNDWQFAFSCNANCEESIILDHLTAGDIYHTDIQFYDANWQFICADRQDIEIQTGNTPCEDNCPPTNLCEAVTITIDENFRGFTIGNLNAPIEIVKIFNQDWQLFYECFADCEDELQFLELSGDRYYVQVNMYDENWTPICDLEEVVEFSNTSESRNTELQAADFALYPNPALGETRIDLQKVEGEAVTLKLFNQFGQEIYQQAIEKVVQPSAKIDLTPFSNGLYLLHLQTKGRKVLSKKLVVNRLY